jgi:hypothetical protein
MSTNNSLKLPEFRTESMLLSLYEVFTIIRVVIVTSALNILIFSIPQSYSTEYSTLIGYISFIYLLDVNGMQYASL